MGHQVIEQVVNAARRKLLVQDLIPLYYPNLYATFELSGKALETTKKYLEHLAVFEGFLVHRFDFPPRTASQVKLPDGQRNFSVCIRRRVPQGNLG